MLTDLDKIEVILKEASPVKLTNDKNTKRAAVALILREVKGGLSIIFIKRSEYENDPWSGHMAFPGGREEEQDDTLYDTVIRETFEETGIDLRGGRIIGRLDDVRPVIRTASRNLIITPFVAIAPQNFEICANDEVEEVVQIPISLLRQRAITTLYEGSIQQFCTYHYRGYIIWGITAWILSQFLNMVSSDPTSKKNFE